MSEDLTTDQVWTLFNLQLTCGKVLLRPARESDLNELARLLPDDFEHNPNSSFLDGLDLNENRKRLLLQDYWQRWGTWSIESWGLNFCAIYEDRVVGIQTLEAENFLELRTVDSSSWLVSSVRGMGLGIAMRTAILGLSFDYLGAREAVTSARLDNASSIGVSRHLGYRDNGVSTSRSPSGVCQLLHMRLTRDEWRANGLGATVTVTGLNSCALYFGLVR